MRNGFACARSPQSTRGSARLKPTISCRRPSAGRLGDRRCPSHVDPVRFLAEVMRSIADSGANKVENQIDVVPVMQPGAVAESAVDPTDSRMSPEQTMAADEDAEALRQAMLGLFPDDPQARDLLDGIMEGYEGEELRTLTDLDETSFASKRRLIRRTIDRHYPKGWKP